MERRTFLRMGSALTLGNALAACGGGDNAPQFAAAPPQYKAVVGWNQTALQAIRNVKPGPPMAARSLAVLHTSMYNAWAAYSPVAIQTPHGPEVRRPESERVADNKAMAMSHAAYRVLVDQFPTQKPLFDSYMTSIGYDPSTSGTDLASPQGIGQTLAAAMLDYCHKDGANQLGDLTAGGVPYADYTGYTPKNPALVVDWCLFAQFVSQRDNNDDDRDVLLFFALANALSDAAVAAWDAKRAYDSERPITAIRYLMQGRSVTGYGAPGVANANTAGKDVGRKVGALVFDKAQRYWSGQA